MARSVPERLPLLGFSFPAAATAGAEHVVLRRREPPAVGCEQYSHGRERIALVGRAGPRVCCRALWRTRRTSRRTGESRAKRRTRPVPNISCSISLRSTVCGCRFRVFRVVPRIVPPFDNRPLLGLSSPVAGGGSASRASEPTPLLATCQADSRVSAPDESQDSPEESMACLNSIP